MMRYADGAGAKKCQKELQARRSKDGIDLSKERGRRADDFCDRTRKAEESHLEGWRLGKRHSCSHRCFCCAHKKHDWLRSSALVIPSCLGEVNPRLRRGVVEKTRKAEEKGDTSHQRNGCRCDKTRHTHAKQGDGLI